MDTSPGRRVNKCLPHPVARNKSNNKMKDLANVEQSVATFWLKLLLVDKEGET